MEAYVDRMHHQRQRIDQKQHKDTQVDISLVQRRRVAESVQRSLQAN